MADPLLEPPDDPLPLLAAWIDEASRAGVALPEAVCLATVSPAGAPTARMVLFRGLERGRLCFFTDYRSRKAADLTENPRAALAFHWQALDRQVRVEGEVERADAATSDRYFASRPRGSQLSAWTSVQSAPVADRESLERRRVEIEARFTGLEVPRPEFWGGFALDPRAFEFWTGCPDRFHDRVRYERAATSWSWRRLQP